MPVGSYSGTSPRTRDDYQTPFRDSAQQRLILNETIQNAHPSSAPQSPSRRIHAFDALRDSYRSESFSLRERTVRSCEEVARGERLCAELTQTPYERMVYAASCVRDFYRRHRRIMMAGVLLGNCLLTGYMVNPALVTRIVRITMATAIGYGIGRVVWRPEL